MQVVEFFELIGRIAQKASPIRVDVPEEDSCLWNYHNRSEQPLHVKIEGLIKVLLSNCVDNWIKEQHPPLDVSIFGEYAKPSEENVDPESLKKFKRKMKKVLSQTRSKIGNKLTGKRDSIKQSARKDASKK